MTEDEAKTKWCPNMGRADVCIASACMAWRRQTVMIDRATNEPALPGVPAIGQLEERYSAHGHCGLGGAPQ